MTDLSKYYTLLDELVAAYENGKKKNNMAAFDNLLNAARIKFRENDDGDKWATFIKHLVIETGDTTIK